MAKESEIRLFTHTLLMADVSTNRLDAKPFRQSIELRHFVLRPSIGGGVSDFGRKNLSVWLAV